MFGISDILQSNTDLKENMLYRLLQDCKYFLGYGFGNEKNLWSHTVEEQVKNIYAIYNSFSQEEKPLWTSLEEIENTVEKMTRYRRNK